MRKRRFLAWLMTMVMAIGLMPATALAADYNDPPAPAPVTSVSTESDNPIQITKSVNEDGNAITMEAYVTNEVTMQDKSKPMDIVLVLDVSGSMAKYITSYQYVATQSQGWSYDDIDDGDYDYYYKDRENYYKVSAKRSSRDWQGNRTYWLEANGQQLGTTSTSKSTDVYTGVLYTRQAANSVTKMAALQSAVNNFIDSVAKDAADNNVAHRISIVKFAGTKNNVVGDDKYDSGQYKYNYSQIVKTLTGVSGNGAGNLKTAVNNLTAAGATSADYGLELAKTVLANSSEANGKAVVMFTDGEPNHGSGFDESVAATAVNTAKNLKDSGAKVFTVGVFDQTYSDTSDVGKYMNAVSSNYPSATASSWGSWWSVNLGVRAEGNFYYTASNAGELDDVFQSISEEISNLTVTADVNAVLTDTLSDKFEFGAAVGTDGSGVTVKKVPVTGKTEDGYTWGSPVDVTGVNVTVNKGTGKIDVKGFDYTSKENAVTAKTVNGNTTYSGYKLVLTFPIAPKADADWEKGTHYYDTNKTAGLTNIKKDNESASELLTDSPQVPVTAYGVTYDPNGGQNPPTDAKGYLSGTEATVLGAGSMTKAGYTFTGWNTEADGSGKAYKADDKIDMSANVTLYAQWTAIDYKVTYQWTGAPADVTLPTDNKTDYHVGDFYTVDSQYTNTTVVEVKNAYGNVIEKYTFSGWKLNGAVVTGTQTMPAADVTLTGVWTKENVTPDKYDVTYEYTGTVPQGAPAVPTKASYEKNQPVTVAAEPILDGYEFSGWETTDVTVSGNTFTMPAKAVAFKGSWTRVKFDVTYDGNGATSGTAPEDSKRYAAGDTVTVLGNTGSLARTGYDFVEWNTAQDGNGTSYKPSDTFFMGSADVTLFAQWIRQGQLGISKTRETTAPTLTSGTVPTEVTYGNVEIPYAGSVTLLYKVTVTNTTPTTLSLRTPVVPAGGNAYTVVEDDGATYVGYYAANGVAAPTSAAGTTVSGVLGPNESIDLYFTKTFVANDVITSNTGATVVTNTATLGEGKPADTEETPAVVKVTVTFDTQGGSAVASQTFDKGGKATEPDDPTRDGYDFTGWYTTEDGDDEFDFDDPVNADTTVYAQWIPKGQLSIDKERATTAPTLTSGTVPAGVIYSNVEIPYAGSVTLLYKVTVTNSNPVPQAATFALAPGGSAYTVVDDGATYVGYYATNGVAAPTSAAGTTVTGELGPNESIDLYFTKTFEATDVKTSKTGATVVENTATLGADKPADTVETPAVVKVTVTYKSGAANDTTHQMEPDVVDKGEDYTVKESAFEYEGFEFVNWLGSDGNEYDAEEVIEGLDEDLTLTAQWIREGELSIEKTRVTELPDVNTVEKNVKFDASEKPVIKYGGEITLLYKVTVENSNDAPPVATFALAPGGSAYTVEDADATYVGYVAENGVAAPTSAEGTTVTGELGPGESIDLYFTKTFEADDVENGKVFNTAVLNGTDEETDKGTDVDVEVRITFDKNALYAQGETYYQDVISGKETDLIPNQFTATGHSFAGWSTTSTGDVEYTDQGEITVTEDTTLYAKWTANTKYMVAYIANGGSGSMPFEFYNSGEKVTVKDCAFTAPTGKVFAGWSTTAKGTVEYEAEDTFKISSNTQLYAIWKDEISAPTQYILTYHANDGSNYTKEEAYPAADELVIVKDDNMFSKPVGKKFTGWSFSANGNAEVKPGDMFLIRQNTDLYAVWEDIEGVSVQKTIEDKQEGPYQFGDEVTFRIVVRNDSDETVNDLLLIEEPGAGLEPVEDPWSLDAAREFLMKLPIMLIPDFVEDIFDLDDEPVVDEPKVDEPKADEPVVDEPVVDEPVVDEPVVDEPKVDEPVVDEPKVDEPVVDEPVVEEPVVEEPKVDEPKVDEPTEFVVNEVAEVPAETLAFEASVPDEPYLVETEDGLCVIIPELAPGEEIEFYYTVKVVDTREAYDPADYTNRVYIDGVEGAEDEVLVPVTGIEIEKSVEKNSKPEPGEWVIYEIVVTNTGAFDLTDVTVTEMPDDEYVDGYFCDENGKEDEDAVDATTYFIDELGAGEDVTLYYRAKVSSKAKDGDELLNDVTVTGTLDNDEKVTATDSNDDVIVEKESHGGIPSKDRPTKPSKVEEVLNTEDHFQYVQGYPDNTVGPERNITRAEATVIFFRLLNDSVRAEYLDAENAFPDVNMNDWFNLGVSTMENGGFVSGYDDGLFRPNANITRAELATIISNFDDLEPAAENKFADVEGHW
ncbi:MAG: InlB B-repeat-containing protein, partial [Anaerotignum sp.]